MAVSLAASVASAMADVVVAAVDAGAAPGTLKVYTGAKPASPATAASGTLLATFTLTDPSAAAAVAGVATFDTDPPIEATVAADGNPGWFRVADSDGNGVFDGVIGADATSTASSWTTGGTVTLSAGTFTMPTA